MQVYHLLYVSQILKILYLFSTKRSYLMTFCKNFIQIWPERVKINFMGINETQQAKPMKQIFIEV